MLPKVLTDILDNRRALCDDDFLVGARRRNANHRRLAQGVDLLQLRAGAEVRIALKHFDVVLEVQFFQ